MPGDFIGVDVAGIKELKAIMKLIPEKMEDDMIEGVNDYLLDILRQYPPQKSVTRKAAYGQTFFSDRQRRYFFRALRKGDIKVPYHRTQKFREGWKKIGRGKDSIIANEVEYGGLLMGDTTQSRMAKLIGWETLENVLLQRKKRIIVTAIQNIGSSIIKKIVKGLGF